MILTRDKIQKTMGCYGNNYYPEIHELIKITNLPILMKQYKVIKQHILLAPYI